jgi:hypothetical protein
MTVTTLLVLIIPSFFVVGLVGCLCNLLSGTTFSWGPKLSDYFSNKILSILQQKKLWKIWKNVFFFSV